MSLLLADIDATCTSLGFHDGEKYYVERDTLAGLKHLIWFLRRDNDTHEYRRHMGKSNVLQSDLLPMLIDHAEDPEFADVLLRLLVNLTFPALLLYREELPKDGPGRRYFLEIIEILQTYKESFTSKHIWAVLGTRLQKTLEIDIAIRSEEQGLLIERVLSLIRNVLQVAANPEAEKRADNDASIHDQVLWSLQQAGMLDVILYILSSEYENQYHLHALEIVHLMFREQLAESLANASLQRSVAEKYQDEQELTAIRRREKMKKIRHLPNSRHSRFGGCYVLKDVKSISDNDIICHQSLEKAFKLDFDMDKNRKKKSHRIVKEENSVTRRSAFSVRLFLREFCIEILESAYNSIVRHVRRLLERDSELSGSNDDSYLLWAITFFMEFNRLSDFKLDLVSESLSIPCFHWVLTRVQHHMDMQGSDKTNSRLWSRRLHIGVKAFRELLYSLNTLPKLKDEKSQGLYKIVQNNIFYVLEYRETMLHLLINYNEARNTKAYLRDVVETANAFLKMMEKFCEGGIVVQEKQKRRRKPQSRSNKAAARGQKDGDAEKEIENLDETWTRIMPQLSTVLSGNDVELPDDEQIIPFDATSDKSIDDQKGDCMIKIFGYLKDEKFEHAVGMLRAGREVWTEDDCFGSFSSAPEDELMIIREIFFSKLVHEKAKTHNLTNDNDNDDDDTVNDSDDIDDEEEMEGGEEQFTEATFKFEDFIKRLVNPNIVRACTIMLSDWERITTRALKSAVTILHRIAVGCKMPTMLFQASLFRIFQKVLNIQRESHSEELRKLAIYIVRQFVAVAPKNPKIYAELLFYKTMKEAYDVEYNYEDHDIGGGGKNVWTEEDETELRILYETNQRNPETDQDVIDWIVENLTNTTRTRRAVIKKLKELNLIFKAPTRKSVAAAITKGKWSHEQDQQLRTLYDEHRHNAKPLKAMMEAIGENRTRNAVIKRMIELGLIADKSEIIATRQKRSRNDNKSDGSSNDEGESDGEGEGGGIDDGDENSEREVDFDAMRNNFNRMKPTKKKGTQANGRNSVKSGGRNKKKPVAKQTAPELNIEEIKPLLAELTNNFSDAISWLQESFDDAIEEYTENAEDANDAVPLVPITSDQSDAMENAKFLTLLRLLAIHEPIAEMEMYWRIPIYFTQSDLKKRSQLLTGLYDDNALDCEISEKLMVSDDDDDDNDNDNDEDTDGDGNGFNDNGVMDKNNEAFDHHKRIIYNESDNEEDQPHFISSRASSSKEGHKMNPSKRGRAGKFDSVKDKKDKATNNDDVSNSDDDDGAEVTEKKDDDILDIQSQKLKKRFAALIDTDDSEDEDLVAAKDTTQDNRNNIFVADEMQKKNNVSKQTKRKYQLIDSDSESESTELEPNGSNKSHSKSSTMEKGGTTQIEPITKKRKSNLIVDDDSDIDVRDDDDDPENAAIESTISSASSRHRGGDGGVELETTEKLITKDSYEGSDPNENSSHIDNKKKTQNHAGLKSFSSTHSSSVLDNDSEEVDMTGMNPEKDDDRMEVENDTAASAQQVETGPQRARKIKKTRRIASDSEDE